YSIISKSLDGTILLGNEGARRRGRVGGRTPRDARPDPLRRAYPQGGWLWGRPATQEPSHPQPGHQVTPQPWSSAPATKNLPWPAKHVTILVVDNSLINLSLMRSTLEPCGYDIITTEGVRQALALARQTPPDLILSDLHMPEEDGYDFIRAVKADPELRRIPLVFLSSTVWREKDRMDGLALGADKFILRPIELQVLPEEIEACLKKQ